MGVLRIKPANCKNCYKCVRVCPVKAIRIRGGQAAVDDDRCIACGQCWRACPQQAKSVQSDRAAVHNLLQSGNPVYVSLAPSLVAAWPGARPGQLVSALQRLGFAGVSQTAVGAALVSRRYQELLQREATGPLLTTACPALVSLVEGYYPHLVAMLAPVPSPLIVHARLLKANQPTAKLVFVGPCLAKKAEAARAEYAGLVDGVLLSSELAQWLAEQAIDPAALPDSPWLPLDQAVAALYPIDGGLLHYLQPGQRQTASVAGMENLEELLRGFGGERPPAALVECNACSGGCLGGPDMPRQASLLERRQLVADYQRRAEASQPSPGQPVSLPLPEQLFATAYRPRPVTSSEPPAAAIAAVLASIGKYSPEQELNCGACGYGSCRAKAAAVLDGMAEPEMCMPFMRSRAESLANLVMESTPNALVVVDRDLLVQEFNPAAERLFLRRAAAIKGLPLSEVIPDLNFRAVRDQSRPLSDQKVAYPELGVITVQTIVPLAGESDSLLGVIVDVTDLERQTEELAVVRAETVIQAQSVIDKQMRVAQEIAGLLGEVTADSKMTLLRLMRLVQGEGESR